MGLQGGSVKCQTEATLEIIAVTEDLVKVLAGKPLENVEVTVHNGIVIATKNISKYNTYVKPSEKSAKATGSDYF